MHILFVTPGFPPFNGGGERYARSLALGLANCGHRVTVVTSSARREQEFWQGTSSVAIERQDDGPLQLIRCPIRPFPGGWRGLQLWRALMIVASALPGDQSTLLLRMARRVPPIAALDETLSRLPEAPDVVNGFNLSWEHALAVGWQYARSHGIPYTVIPFSHFGEAEQARVARNATMEHQRRILQDADAVLTLTAIEEEGFRRWQIAPRRVTVIGGGVELPPPAVDPEAVLERHRLQPPYALFVGRANYDKGAVHAVHALARLLPTFPTLSLVLAGRTTPEFEQALKQLPPAARSAIRPLGTVEETEKHALLQKASMLLLPSRADSFGIVLLEAWQHNTPVVAARAGGIPGVVDEGRNGLLVPFGDEEALASAMARLLADDELRRTLGQNGQEKVRRQYNWDHVAQRVLDLYETILDKRG